MNKTIKFVNLWVLSLALFISSQSIWANEKHSQDHDVLYLLQGHWDRISDVVFSPNGKYLATASGSNNKSVIIWNIKDGTRKFTIKNSRNINAISFSPDSKYIATGGGYKERSIKIYSTKNGELRKNAKMQNGEITDLNYSPDGKSIIVSYVSDRSSVQIISTNLKKVLAQLEGHTKMVQGAMFSPDGKSAITYALDEKIVVWNVKTGYRRFAINRKKLIDDIAISANYSADGQTIATISGGKNIVFWDANNGHKKGSISGINYAKHGLLTVLDFHPNGNFIAVGSSNGNAYLFEVKTGRLQKILDGGGRNVTRAIAFNVDGSLLVAGRDDGTAIVWKVNMNDEDKSTGVPTKTLIQSPTSTIAEETAENSKVVSALEKKCSDMFFADSDTENLITACKLAAEKGNSYAQFTLGIIYEGEKRNYTQALKWHRKAAAQGVKMSQYKIGTFYEEGLGIEKNYVLAIKWYRKSISEKNSKKRLRKLYAQGIGSDDSYVGIEKLFTEEQQLARLKIKVAEEQEKQKSKNKVKNEIAELEAKLEELKKIKQAPSKKKIDASNKKTKTKHHHH